MVNKAVIKPFRLPYNSLLFKTQSLRDCAALLIFNGATYLNAVQPKLIERIVHQYPTGIGHQPLSLKRGSQPVTNACRPIHPVNFMIANNPRQSTSKPNTRLETAIIRKLLKR